jgi:Ca2+-binding EF-hand superfamily protein
MGITLIWIVSGTLFYSYCNDWPLAQSFFYAVDAGMSIGFCTDVAETKLTSKAFTIVYILLGASVVGGALALFIQDAVEGVSAPSSREYQLFLEKKVFQRANLSHSGALSYPEFKTLILSSINEPNLSEDDVLILWNKFDRLKDGVIHFEEFVGTFRGIKRLVLSIQHSQESKTNRLRILGLQIRLKLQQAWQLENRIYFCWLFWVGIGIFWGLIDQNWDPITATHFSISALATGGLTAPQVNSEGILPAEPSIFCGIFCLIGIPLFALTLGHFAKALVKGHVSAMETNALTRPMSRVEYETAKHLTTKDSLVHLSDYIVMQLLRQGRITPETIKVLKENFELLDKEKNGALTPEQATSVFINHPVA